MSRINRHNRNLPEFIAKDGNKYEIAFDGTKAVVLNSNGDEVGSMSFDEVQVPHGYETLTYLHLCHMDMKNHTGLGLGRATLDVARKESGFDIAASDPGDHVPKDDGSHLVGDGPGFVRKMQAEGRIMGSASPDYDDGEY